jgi:hypothetical protein
MPSALTSITHVGEGEGTADGDGEGGRDVAGGVAGEVVLAGALAGADAGAGEPAGRDGEDARDGAGERGGPFVVVVCWPPTSAARTGPDPVGVAGGAGDAPGCAAGSPVLVVRDGDATAPGPGGLLLADGGDARAPGPGGPCRSRLETARVAPTEITRASPEGMARMAWNRTVISGLHG